MNRTPCMGVGGAGFGNQKGHGKGHYHQHQVGFRRPAGAAGSAGPRGAHRSSGHRHRCAHVAVVPAARAPADCLISPLPHAPPLHLPHAYAPPLAPARTTSRSIGTSHHFPRLTLIHSLLPEAYVIMCPAFPFDVRVLATPRSSCSIMTMLHTALLHTAFRYTLDARVTPGRCLQVLRATRGRGGLRACLDPLVRKGLRVLPAHVDAWVRGGADCWL